MGVNREEKFFIDFLRMIQLFNVLGITFSKNWCDSVAYVVLKGIGEDFNAIIMED